MPLLSIKNDLEWLPLISLIDENECGSLKQLSQKGHRNQALFELSEQECAKPRPL